MKTKLNKDLRARLTRLAHERVHDTDTMVALTATRKACEKMILRLIKATFPPKDMVVLAKYDCAKPSTRWDLLIVADSESTVRYDHWELPNQTKEQQDSAPLKAYAGYGGRRLRIESKDDVAIYNDYASAHAAHEKARQDKLRVFSQLIANANTLDQVEEVWPAAREVRPYAKNLLPTVALAPLMDQVRAIVEAKQA